MLSVIAASLCNSLSSVTSVSQQLGWFWGIRLEVRQVMGSYAEVQYKSVVFDTRL